MASRANCRTTGIGAEADGHQLYNDLPCLYSDRFDAGPRSHVAWEPSATCGITARYVAQSRMKNGVGIGKATLWQMLRVRYVS